MKKDIVILLEINIYYQNIDVKIEKLLNSYYCIWDSFQDYDRNDMGSNFLNKNF